MPENSQECPAEEEEAQKDDNWKDKELSSLDFSRQPMWIAETAHQFLPFLARAHKLLKQSYSTELLFMANLSEQFPGMLKPLFAGVTATKHSRQTTAGMAKNTSSKRARGTTPGNPNHIAEALRRDAERVLIRPLRSYNKLLIIPKSRDVFSKVPWYRFRYPDTALIPSDWCFALFALVRKQYPLLAGIPKLPQDLLPAMEEALAGMAMVYHHSTGRYTAPLRRVYDTGMPDTERLKAILDAQNLHPHVRHVGGLPRPLRELSWLRSFLTCVDWMEQAFSELALLCKTLDQRGIRFDIRDLSAATPFPPLDCREFVDQAPTELLGACLLRDFELCSMEATTDQATGPTDIALHLPSFSSTRGREIARYLVPSEAVSVDIQQLMYDSMRDRIATYLQRASRCIRHNDDRKLACEPADGATDGSTGRKMERLTDEATARVASANVTQDSASQEPVQSVVRDASLLLTSLLESLPPDASAAEALEIMGRLNIDAAPEEETRSAEEPDESRTT